MTRLSDTQLVMLSAAAQRADLSVLPLPDSLTLKGGALNKVMDSLRNRGLIRVIGGDGGPERVVITSEGMAAIGVEADDDEALARLQALSDYHFNYSPDEVTWCHVGTLEHYTELLKRITDQAFHEGDHAE